MRMTLHVRLFPKTLTINILYKALFLIHQRKTPASDKKYQHWITIEIHILPQIFCEWTYHANFLQKINQAFQSWNVTWYQLSHDALRPTCHTICHIPGNLVGFFLYWSFLSFRRSLSATMDPNLLCEWAQRLLETADFIRNRTAAVTSTTQTTTVWNKRWQARHDS